MRHAWQEQPKDPSRLDRAINLFEFFAQAQKLKSAPVRNIDTYAKDGAVLWLSNWPNHPAVSTPLGGAPGPEEPVLTVERIPRVAPPEPPASIRAWIDGPLDDPAKPPTVRPKVDELSEPPSSDEAAASPGFEDDDMEFARRAWMADWEAWTIAELGDRPSRELYHNLFTTYVRAAQHPDEVELVLGVALLTSGTEAATKFGRHLFTFPLAIDHDDHLGRLTVRSDVDTRPMQLELDMVPTELIQNPGQIAQLRAAAREFASHPLHRDGLGDLARRVVHTIDPDGQYEDRTDHHSSSAHMLAVFAPAIILRKRSGKSLVEAFEAIVDQLRTTGIVPAGVIPLVDPDFASPPSEPSGPGAAVQVDDEIMLPMPVNDKQLAIIERVDRQALTLVQGPPGTGKTHTAAALISHLLAQGKRVLVTAHTDRALSEVRSKLPSEIKPLAVSVIGSSREDLNQLKVAVEAISSRASEFRPEESAQNAQSLLTAIDKVRRQRAEVISRLVDARGIDVATHSHAGYHGTVGRVAQNLEAQRVDLDWFRKLQSVPAHTSPGMTSVELGEFLTLIRDKRVREDEQVAMAASLDLYIAPPPEKFIEMVRAEQRALSGTEAVRAASMHPAYAELSRLPWAIRNELQQRFRGASREVVDLERRQENWMNGALRDVRIGRGSIWSDRARQIGGLIERISDIANRLPPTLDLQVQGDVGQFSAYATSLIDHLNGGGEIKRKGDGSVNIGMMTPRIVKQALPLFQNVRVDYQPPTTIPALSAFLAWVDAQRGLDALDRAWPAGVDIPDEDTVGERLQWHRTELEQLHRILSLGRILAEAQSRLRELGLPYADWADLHSVREYAALVDAAASAEAVQGIRNSLAHVVGALSEGSLGRIVAGTSEVSALRTAVSDRDESRYHEAHERLVELVEVRAMVARRNELAAKIDAMAPALRQAILASPDDSIWDLRLGRFESAWAWASTLDWIARTQSSDVNALQSEVRALDLRLHTHIEELAAARAWAKAVAPERLGGQSRADLINYAQLVRRLGRGTGIYADQRRGEIRVAMDRCRSSVPVWIMPLYRVAEQLTVQPDMFDVVVVDEASQAGLEATFLQYLAPKMLVIGDDKQVSPSAVGVNQQALRDLASQYLKGDRYYASWQDPTRSLFDEAKMRYGGTITLTEHRRCVPEIIGFSNRIAYEPENIRLVPVRQYGLDRLEPLKPVRVHDGYESGSTNKTNRPEADAIVAQIEKCLADPAYDGCTMGVISLLGPHQARLIQDLLIDRLSPGVWSARELRCGDAADFQGSERDVMFLSMVAAPRADRRLTALTANTYLQRYNVAASRAKDQMWVFHSMALSDLTNSEDMRFQLLDYCYGVSRRAQTEDDRIIKSAVSDDVRAEPFDSLFEQRVFNRLVDRGYSVIPQYESLGYKIDLVVKGTNGNLAIECDGDRWHGPDRYRQDLARQRELERCGWNFYRVRESTYYADPAAELRRVWSALEDRDIRPSSWLSDNVSGVDSTLPTAEPQVATIEVPPVAGIVPDSVQVEAPPAVNEPAPTPIKPTKTVAPTRNEPKASTSAPPSNETVTTNNSPVAHVRRYSAFEGVTASPTESSLDDRVNGLVEIARAEGPVLGDRLINVYARAAGLGRTDHRIAEVLTSTLDAAVRRGVLIGDQPLQERGARAQTYRLSDQPEISIRSVGPRQFEQIPPAEVGALMKSIMNSGVRFDHDDLLFRAVLNAFGVPDLTAAVLQRLTLIKRELVDILPPALEPGIGGNQKTPAADLIQQFDRRMHELCRRAKSEAGFTSYALLRMLTQYGSIETAHRLLENQPVPYGLAELWEGNRLDLTVENLALESQFRQMFSDDELARARQRLARRA